MFSGEPNVNWSFLGKQTLPELWAREVRGSLQAGKDRLAEWVKKLPRLP